VATKFLGKLGEAVEDVEEEVEAVVEAETEVGTEELAPLLEEFKSEDIFLEITEGEQENELELPSKSGGEGVLDEEFKLFREPLG
jgi:hypothetical protein